MTHSSPSDPTLDQLLDKLELRRDHGPNDLHELVYQLALHLKAARRGDQGTQERSQSMSDTKLRVFTNDTDTVVAVDLTDAQRVVEAQYGHTFEQEGWTLDDWGEVDERKPITIRNLNGNGWDDAATKTAAEWVVSHGRGFLCSTEW